MIGVSICDLCNKKGIDFDDLEVRADLGEYSAQIILGMLRTEQGDYESGEELCLKGFWGAAKAKDTSVKMLMDVIKLNSLNNSDFQQLYFRVKYPLALALKDDSLFTEIVKWAEPLADSGSSFCQYVAGVLYAQGKGVQQDYSKALEYLNKSADNGEDKAQFQLAKMYLTGDGVEEDTGKGSHYMTEAVRNGNADAAEFMGRLFLNDKNYKEAAILLLRAAKKGKTHAQFLIGLMFLQGQGVEENHSEGIRWLRKAAEGNNDDAKILLEKLDLRD